MSQTLAYWDSSALVPLCAPQPQSAHAAAIYKNHQVVAWWATAVEIISGLTRLERMKQISHAQSVHGKRLAREIVQAWFSAGSPASVAAQACSLLDKYTLRAADALQLSVALEACGHQPQGFLFVTADLRLADAARSSGFAVQFL